MDRAGNFTVDQEVSNSETFLNLWLIRAADNSIYVISDDWMFDQSGGGSSLSDIGVEIQIGPRHNYIRIEASATIGGYRAGYNDPFAGMVDAVFQDYKTPGLTPVRIAGHFSPFDILGMSLFYRTR